jgi:alpha-beta hydrolase superfamily lysophospholipase
MVESGLNVFLFDYRGFGRSAGFATLAGVLQDAEAAAREHHAIRPHGIPSILYGYSLGGAIAAQTAQHVYFDGLIMQSTFTNLADMARVRFPKLPIHLISGHDFNSIDVIRRLRIPMVVIHGTEDDVVPHWMGTSLFKSCATAHDIHLINGAMHTDLWERDAEGIVDFIARFALSLRRHHEPHPVDEIEPPTLLDRFLATIRHRLLRGRGSGLRPVVAKEKLA